MMFRQIWTGVLWVSTRENRVFGVLVENPELLIAVCAVGRAHPCSPVHDTVKITQ